MINFEMEVQYVQILAMLNAAMNLWLFRTPVQIESFGMIDNTEDFKTFRLKCKVLKMEKGEGQC